MNTLKIKNILIFFGAISIFIMGVKDFYITTSVPKISDLQRISGEIYEHSCRKNSKRGDHFNFKLIGDSESIIMSRIVIECNTLISELKRNNFKIDVWVDSNSTLPLGYAMLIDEKFYQSYMLGVTNDKSMNIVSFFMVIASFGMLTSVFNKTKGHNYFKR